MVALREDLDSSTPEQTEGTEVAEEPLQRLLRYSHIYTSAVREIVEEKLLREASPLPLTLSQFHLLKLMTVNGRHQIGELAEFLGVSAPAVTKNIDKLVRLGLVLRAPAEGDRRVTIVTPSRKGRRLVSDYETLKIERLAPVLEDFTGDEIEQLTGLLARLSVSLLSRERTRRGFCLRCAAYIETGCPVGHIRGACPYDRFRETDVESKGGR
jgi:DNA-binding MarR family transcriptional regulator